MKFIGQFIQQLVSRFRNDVYLEALHETAQDHVVGVDSDGKLYKQDVATGDITGVTAGTNLGGGGTSGNVTIDLENASTSVKGAASFSSDNFVVSSGDVRVKSGGIDLADEVTGFLPIANGGTGANNAGGARAALGVDAAGTDNSTNVTLAGTPDYITISGQEITRNQIDLTTDVTGSLPTSNMASRYTYQYLTFSFKAQDYISETWYTPSQNGPEYYFWNNTHGTSGSEPASHTPANAVLNTSTIDVDYFDQPSGFVIPKDCQLDGFYGNARTSNTTPSSARPVMGLFRATEPADSNNVDIQATCIALDKYDTSTGNRKNRFMKLETSGLNAALSQGDLLFPAIGLDEAMSNSDGAIWGSFTIVLKTLTP